MKRALAGKRTIITGASSGIGRALAAEAAREKMRLVLAARSAEKLQELAEGLKKGGADVVAVAADVTVAADRARLVQTAVASLGGLDVLIGFRRSAPVQEPMKNATGIVLCLAEQHYLATALHVLEDYETRKSAGEALLFQAADLPFEPDGDAAVRFGRPNDLVLIPLTVDQAHRVGRDIYRPHGNWPPDLPASGSWICFCGFPGDLRKPTGHLEYELTSWALIARLSDVSGVHGTLICKLEKSEWIAATSAGLPPADMKLGGLSGGPVFLVDRLSLPLVGLVVCAAFDVLTIQPFLPVEPSSS